MPYPIFARRIQFETLFVHFFLKPRKRPRSPFQREDVNELRRKKAKLKEALMKAEGDATPPNMKEIIEEIRGSLIEINPAKVLLMQVRDHFPGFGPFFSRRRT